MNWYELNLNIFNKTKGDTMVTMESLVKFSGKPEEEVKKEVEAAMKEMNIAGMDDATKLDFAMNQLHSKYSKEEFKSSSEIAEGFILGYSRAFDNITKVREDTQKFINDSPEDAKKLNMQDASGNLLYYETQQVISTKLDWQVAQKYRELDTVNNPEDKDIIPALTYNGKPIIGIEIPLVEKTKYVYGYHLVDGNWTQFVQKLSYKLTREDKEKGTKRPDNTAVELPTFQLGKFPVYEVKNQTEKIGFTYFSGSGKYKFEFIKAMEDSELESILATQQTKYITLQDIEKFAGNVVAGNNFVIVKARVHDIGVLDNGGPIIKVHDDTLMLGEKDAKGERITPVSCYPPENYKPMFSDGSEITLFGKPRLSEKGVKSMTVYGIYVPTMYKTQVPKPDPVEL